MGYVKYSKTPIEHILTVDNKTQIIHGPLADKKALEKYCINNSLKNVCKQGEIVFLI